MNYRIRIVEDADAELRTIPVFHRRRIAEAIARLLGAEPERKSKSRIKRLVQPAASVYRLRVGGYRVFYDVKDDKVTVLHIRHKKDTEDLYGGLDMKIDTLAHVKNQLSSVIEQLGKEPLFITRNGKITAVLQSLVDDEVEDYLFRNSRRFWRLMETRRTQVEQGRTLPFDPTRYQQEDASD